MTRWKALPVLLVVVTLLAMAAGSGGAGPARGGTLTMVIGSDPPSLDPHRTPSVSIAHAVM